MEDKGKPPLAPVEVELAETVRWLCRFEFTARRRGFIGSLPHLKTIYHNVSPSVYVCKCISTAEKFLPSCCDSRCSIQKTEGTSARERALPNGAGGGKPPSQMPKKLPKTEERQRGTFTGRWQEQEGKLTILPE